jgi:hypothetical protein
MKKTLILVLLCISWMVHATTYYIDPAGIDNAGRNGTIQPWKTLAYACGRVKTAGDIIHINAGTYNESVQSMLAVGVTLEGDGNTSIITSTTLTSEGSAIISVESGSVVDGNQEIRYLKFDGHSLAAAQALWIDGRNKIKIHHCTFVDFHYMAIFWTGLGGTEDTPPSSYVTGSEFYNNTVTNCAGYAGGWYRGALFIGGQDGMLIHDNVMVETGRSLGAQGWPIKNWANGGWMRGCKIYNNRLEKTDASVWSFAFEGDNQYGLEIYNNTIIGSIDVNYCTKGSYDYGLYVHDNTIGPPSLGSYAFHGIILEFDMQEVIIERNRLNNCIPLHFTPRAGTVLQYITIRNNVMNNCPSISYFYGGLRIMGGSAYTLHHLYIENNVFYGSTTSDPIYGIIIDSEGSNSIASYISIINNIFVNFGQRYLYLSHSTAVDYLDVENNLVYNCGGSNQPYYAKSPTHYTNLNNILGSDPLFVSPIDFHLQSSSPAIGAGIAIPEITTDFEGKAFRNPPNIGCYATPYSNNKPPVVSITYPTKSSSFTAPATITINANAYDPDGTVTKVEFFSGTNKLGELTTVPYSIVLKNVIAGTYSITAVATDNQNATATSPTVIVEVSVITLEAPVNSVDDANKESLVLYPNPNNGLFSLDLANYKQEGNKIITIFDLAGKIVYNETLLWGETIKQFDLSHIPSGIYIIKVNSKTMTVIKKFYKN